MKNTASLPALALACLVPLFPAEAAERPQQLVLVSFDGAGDNALWEKSREMARRVDAHFTYFLSCTLVMDRETGKAYRAPGKKPGRSNIGFGADAAEVTARLGHIWSARAEGHEIGSHTCGHFDGGQWTKAEWRTEFSAFRETLETAWEKAGAGEDEPEGWRDFARNEIAGFRAPYLSAGDGLFEALAEDGFAYDASGVTRGPADPVQKAGLWRFGLPMIPEGPKARPVIGMDYNLYARHSGAKEDAGRGAEYEERAHAAFRAAFDREYEGGRVPLQLGFHFVEMNGGAYWRALDRLLTEVCGLPDVACVSYREAVSRFEADRERPVGATAPRAVHGAQETL